MANLIDKAIELISPKAAYKRATYKKAATILSDKGKKKRRYEGASKTRRTQNWRTSGNSANAETETSIAILRNRARDLVRNNGYAARAVDAIQTNTIGPGIKLNINSEDQTLLQTTQSLWRAWAGNAAAIDFDGALTFAGIQRLGMRALPESGEFLIRRRRLLPEQGLLPIQLQVLESDFLATDQVFSNAETGNDVIQGIEVDQEGRRVAYHLFEDHPGSTSVGVFRTLRNTLRTVRIPAEDIIHVYRQDRPGQLRGVSWFAPIMIDLRDLDEFEDAQLVRQKIAACFAAFIHDTEPPVADTSGPDDPFPLEKLEPGIVEQLPPGKNITFGTPPLPGQDSYKTFVGEQLHRIASGLGISYEALTGQLSDVNFSSARMGWLEFQRNVDTWRSTLLIPNFLDKVFSWFQEAVFLSGLPRVLEVQHNWLPPRREMIDPTKEIPSRIKSVRAGFESLSDIIRQNGKEPEAHFEEIRRERELAASLGLVFDSDPSQTSGNGATQATATEDTEETETADDEPVRSIG